MTKLGSLVFCLSLAAPSAAIAEPVIHGDVQLRVKLPKIIIQSRDRQPRGYVRFESYEDRTDRVERWRGRYNVTGTYDSPYGRVYLQQDGSRVTGTFDGGRIKGMIKNNALYFRWKADDVEGHGRWFLKDGRQRTFEGTWGTWESASNAGRFTLTRVGVSNRDR
jgi:hypothetical protein